jgi:hypothetical protein
MSQSSCHSQHLLRLVYLVFTTSCVDTNLGDRGLQIVYPVRKDHFQKRKQDRSTFNGYTNSTFVFTFYSQGNGQLFPRLWLSVAAAGIQEGHLSLINPPLTCHHTYLLPHRWLTTSFLSSFWPIYSLLCKPRAMDLGADVYLLHSFAQTLLETKAYYSVSFRSFCGKIHAAFFQPS